MKWWQWNVCRGVRRVQKYFIEYENLSVSKYILMKLLHQIGFNYNKEVFVKHEQAPTAPKLEGVWVFVYLKYIFY